MPRSRTRAGSPAAIARTTRSFANSQRSASTRPRNCSTSACSLHRCGRTSCRRGIACCLTSFGGGSGVICTDQCGREGLAVPPLDDATRARVAPLLTPLSSAINPIDLTPAMMTQPAHRATLPEAMDVSRRRTGLRQLALSRRGIRVARAGVGRHLRPRAAGVEKADVPDVAGSARRHQGKPGRTRHLVIHRACPRGARARTHRASCRRSAACDPQVAGGAACIPVGRIRHDRDGRSRRRPRGRRGANSRSRQPPGRARTDRRIARRRGTHRQRGRLSGGDQGDLAGDHASRRRGPRCAQRRLAGRGGSDRCQRFARARPPSAPRSTASGSSTCSTASASSSSPR